MTFMLYDNHSRYERIIPVDGGILSLVVPIRCALATGEAHELVHVAGPGTHQLMTTETLRMCSRVRHSVDSCSAKLKKKRDAEPESPNPGFPLTDSGDKSIPKPLPPP